jgi:hypothetical protein
LNRISLVLSAAATLACTRSGGALSFRELAQQREFFKSGDRAVLALELMMTVPAPMLKACHDKFRVRSDAK